LSPAQAFARVYESPANADLARKERDNSRRALQEGFARMYGAAAE
jgi:hypothetical protein